MAKRPCLDCGALATKSRCPSCTSTRERARSARRGTTTQRGYGHAYRTRRDQAVKDATHCTRCGTPFTPHNPATGGHTTDLRTLPQAGRQASAHTAHLEPQCARCNYGWRRHQTA